ncbi:hypothetical protein RF11_05413 [Thelohanellus kitauei]|uniref:Uncharacterized protein n=1 Tax=Thelohanellus kitauei TaxID=669202 RepID=A0A0C2M5H0_THEKT|nr:hypothetical protein RF11_05413 [Thelohanellus kitauei]
MLIQDYTTRWNSTLQIIERLTRNNEAVIATLNSSIHKYSFTLLTDAGLENLRIMELLLEQSRYLTEILRGEWCVSCSVILPTITCPSRFMVVTDYDSAFGIKLKTGFFNGFDTHL